MAGATELIGNVLVIGNIERLMNPVTGHTVGKFLPFTMRLMTLHAVGDIAVFVMMADCAVKTAMSTGIVFYLVDLGRMTGVADGNVIFTKGDMQGLVWILMAVETGCFYFKMGLSFMTHGTLGNDLTLCRRGGMAADMAIKAGYLGFMARAIIHVLVDNRWMAFYTVADLQHRIRSQGIPC